MKTDRREYLYVINYGYEDGGKCNDLDDSDIEDLRQQIREQMAQDVPVVVLPKRLYLMAVELSHPPEAKNEPAKAEA